MKKILSIVMLLTILTASAVSASDIGTVGFVIHTGDVWTSVNGIIQETEGAVIVKPDGTTETCATLYEQKSLLNKIVTVSPAEFGSTLSSIAQPNKISGPVDARTGRIGTYKVSADVNIIDIASLPLSENQNFAVISLDRLDGLTLDTGDVLYSDTDQHGEITALILNDVTGDAYIYGLTTDTTIQRELDVTKKEKIIISNGLKWNCSADHSFTLKKNIPVRVAPHVEYKIIKNDETDVRTERITSDTGVYDFAANLNSYGVASTINDNVAIISGMPYRISKNVQVFFRNGFNVIQTSLSSVITGKYKLSCYYDRPESKGGRIRVIIAE